MSDFEINRNVEIPPATSGRRPGSSKYPFAKMRKGDSFFVPGGTPSRMSGALSAFKKANPELKFTCRSVTENEQAGVRIWRVE